LEINSNPDRLDLDDDYSRMAKELGVKISVSTDAHSVNSLQYIEYGIAQARRGWLEKDDVINTRSLNN
jgi:DNA polymerase (family X)